MDKKAKIQAALDALPNATDGDWWIDDHRGEMHNDPIGSVKLKIVRPVFGSSAIVLARLTMPALDAP